MDTNQKSNQSKNAPILFLPSWYPNKLSPFEGDFIQRHAKAASLYNEIVVIHVKKDVDGVITSDVKETITTFNNLTEIIIYYYSFKSRIGSIDRMISVYKYINVYISAIKKYFKKNPETYLVHVHVAMRAGLLALYLKLAKKIPFIVTEHWSGYYKQSPVNIHNSGIWQKWLTKKILTEAEKVLPVGSSLEDAIKRLVDVDCSIINNVVDTRYFFYKPVSKQKFTFIHASSMNDIKNPQGIIRAAKMLAEEGYQFKLLLIGNLSISNFAKEIALPDDFIFCEGEISYQEIAERMQASSALVMFSRYETMPCVILEALCCGLPVISSSVGSIEDVITNKNGFLVESENEVALKDAMKKMIANYQFFEKELIARIAFNKYSYEVVGKQFDEIYKSL